MRRLFQSSVRCRAAFALTTAVAAVGLAVPAHAAPPSADRLFLPAYDGSATFAEYDEVEANANSAVMSADHLTGDLAVNVSASCSALVCDGFTSRTHARAELRVAYKAKKEPVTMRVSVAFRDPVPKATRSGTHQRSPFAGLVFHSDGVPIGGCSRDVPFDSEDSLFVECTFSDPDGGSQSITAYLGATVYDQLGDGIAEHLGVRGHVQSIYVDVL